MSIDSRIAALKQDIVEHLAVLDRTERYADEYFVKFGPGPRTAADAFLVTGVLSNYYTCLETVFLRISEYFENSLAPARWHKDLLEKMTLSIEGVRPRLLAEDTVLPLQELLRFRHFCRYYFARVRLGSLGVRPQEVRSGSPARQARPRGISRLPRPVGRKRP